MKVRTFWGSILIIILSYIGNYLFFESKQLAAPLFLDHYYETSINIEGDNHLPFYYLANKSDFSTVSHVDINGETFYPLSTQYFNMWDTNTPQYEQEFTHHYLKAVTLSIPSVNIQDNIPFEFSNMIVHFSDGKTIQADIGNVILHKSNPKPQVLETRYSGSSNQHRETKSFITLQPITIEDITVPFPEEIADEVLVKVDLNQERLSELEELMTGAEPPNWLTEGRDKKWSSLPGVLIHDELFPFSLKQSEWILLLMKYNPTRNSYFTFSVKIIGKTESGEPFILEAPISDAPSLDQKKINNIIKTKKSGENE
ncbi:hypothetical protein ACLM5H_14455 [Fredinandcohnia humi]